MASRNYDRLHIEDFGEHLLQSGDLDPIYIALVRSDWDDALIRRWLLAYWTFYDAGVSCWIANAGDTRQYWKRFHDAARNDDWAPHGGRYRRGHERRHMRGRKALDCFEGLKQRYPEDPAGFTDYCVPGPSTCREVMHRVNEHRQFGPWIGFKVADMAERVLGVPVDFSESEVWMFNDPKKAAITLWRRQAQQHPKAKPRDERTVLTEIVAWLTKLFASFKAPPRYDRPVGLQEVETILCKWKSHMNGHYPLNNDIVDIRNGLAPWLRHSPLSQQFLKSMP